MHIRTFAAIAAVCATLGMAEGHAADATFTSESLFQAAAGTTVLESFESVAARARANTPVVAPLLTVNPLDGAMIGIQDGANSPGSGFGSYATEGTRYLLSYVDPVPGVFPGPDVLQPTGTLHFALNGPARAFGLTITDVGEVNGTVVLRTGNGGFVGGVTLLSFPPTAGNGGQFFIGLTQDESFTDVYLTVSAPDEAFGVDRLLVASVPEPAEYALLLAGLVLVGAAVRRRA
jgi:hypothetical protein